MQQVAFDLVIAFRYKIKPRVNLHSREVCGRHLIVTTVLNLSPLLKSDTILDLRKSLTKVRSLKCLEGTGNFFFAFKGQSILVVSVRNFQDSNDSPPAPTLLVVNRQSIF